MKLSAKRAFTLVEIMIVVAIIGIIIAIAVPAFIRARENARGRACQENLSKLDGAKEQYLLEKKETNGFVFNEDQSDLFNADGTGYLKSSVACPAGGTYTVGAGDVVPACDYEEETWSVQHTLSGEAAAAAAAAVAG